MSAPVGDRTPAQRLAHLRARRGEMVETLSRLVEAESSSNDLERLEACATLVSSVGADVTGCPAQVVRVEDRPHLEWRFGATTRVALIGHFDTVWPTGTIARRPFTYAGDVITGPGSLMCLPPLILIKINGSRGRRTMPMFFTAPARSCRELCQVPENP